MILSKSRRMLILSGILSVQETEMIAELERRGLSGMVVERAGEWISVTVRTAAA
jgi:ribosomal protein L11 methylase PrmA